MKNKYLHIVIGLVIIGLSLYYAFKDVSPADIVRALASADYIYLFPALLSVAMSYLLRAVRWRYLLASVKTVRTRNLFSPLMVGFMGNMLPARAGEIIRPYLLSKKEQISFSASFATIFIERLFDMSLVLLLLFWVLFFKADLLGTNHALMNYMTRFGWVSLVICTCIFIFSVFLQYKNDLAMKVVSLVIRPFPPAWGKKMVSLVHSFNDGLMIIKDKRGFFVSMILSVLIWSLFVGTNFPLYLAFGIHTQVPVISSLVILCLTVAIFITLFPTPGFLGSFQAAHVVALHEIFGVSKAVSVSYGIVSWLIIMGFTVSVGAVYAIKDNISFTEMTAPGKNVDGSSAQP